MLIGLIMSSIPETGTAQGGGLPPIYQFGYLGYDFSAINSDATDSQTHFAMVNWNIASYIKQPYIGQYFGGLTLRYDVGKNSDTEDNKRHAIFGNLRLRLFPMSPFPFEAYWLEENQQTDQDEASLITKRRVLGLVQRYTHKKTGFNALFRVENNKQEFDDRVAERNQIGKNFLTNLDFSMPIGKWNLNWRNQYRTDENSNSGYQVTRLHSILRHAWRPGPQFSMNGFTSYRDITRDREDGFVTEDKRAELNNYLNWRPATSRPLLVTSIFRHVEFLGSNSNTGGLTGGTTTLLGTANYQFTDTLSFYSSASGSLLRNGLDEKFRSAALAEARYQPLPHRWGTFTYQWNAALGTRWEDQKDEFGGVFTGTGRAGHSLDKVFTVAERPIIVRFSQLLTALEGTDGQSTQILSQTINLSWNRNTTRRSSVLSASLSDNRSKGGGGRVGDQDRKLQMATVLFSQTENLSRNSRLMGSASLQVRRNASGGRFGKSTTPSGTADLTYLNQMLFYVPLLQFRSTLRWYSSNFNSSLDVPGQSAGSEGLFWDNRLDYRIGRLDFRLLLRISSVNDIDRSLVYFSIRRNFGGLMN